MDETAAQMTKAELRDMLDILIEQKLLELLGDPGEGLTIRKPAYDRLLRQKQAVAKGERGEPSEDVVQRLDLSQELPPGSEHRWPARWDADYTDYSQIKQRIGEKQRHLRSI